MSIYAATKAAVVSFGKTLAVELAPRGIRVNTLSPGPVDTPIIDKAGIPPEAKDALASKSLVKRWGSRGDCQARSLLLSDDSSFIIGEEIVIDGGMSRA